MNNIMDVCHVGAFDEMYEMEMEASYSWEDSCKPSKCALNEEPLNARCISTDSDSSSDPSSSGSESEVHNGRGRDIFHDYDVLPAILGTGNYGCVRECVRRSTGARYAVKTIEKAKVSRQDHIQREIELLRSVDHPGIMKLVDCYEDDDYVHIVTEKYTGGELFDRIVDNTTDTGCLREDEAVRIVRSLLEAVRYLHDRDIVHRDIKPENVLFETAAEGSPVRLIDFGLSRTHGPNDRAMTNEVGTPYYVSPGVLRGRYDRSCDLWAVGVTAYIVLCGYPPFNGPSDREVHASILRGRLVFERQVWANLSPASRDFVSKLLCRDQSKIMSAEEALRHPWIASA